jgi:hypothetical protein
VLWTPGGEPDIADFVSGSNPMLATSGGPAVSVPISGWFNGPTPTLGDPWAMVTPLNVITPAAPATGFANSAGLVVA